jgi:tRNA threonylcarbamoyl adenosine modification protein YeaZ
MNLTTGGSIVAQVSTLLYRRLPVGHPTINWVPADWKSAIQQAGSLRYEALGCASSGLNVSTKANGGLPMKILALELSSEVRTVTVLDAATGRSATVSEARARHTRVFALIQSALQEAGVKREEIDCLAVGIGPGSYTGIRMAISVVQGWHAALGTKLLAISSVDCLAAGAHVGGLHGETDFIIDAQRGEFYLAAYEITPAGCREVESLRLVPAAQVEERLRAGRRVLGPDAARAFPSAKDFFPDAAMLAKLAASRTDFLRPEQLEPIYLRPVSFVKAPPPRKV